MMKLVKVKALFLLIALFFISSLSSLGAEPVELELKTEIETVQPGSPFWVALDLKMEEGWHAYWKNPGDSGMAPQIEWTLPEGFVVDDVEWPHPSHFEVGPLEAFGYADKAVLLARIIPPVETTLTKVTIKADVRWVVCNDETCLPGSSDSEINLAINKECPVISAAETKFFEEARQKIPQKLPITAVVDKANSKEVTLRIELSDKELATVRFYPETGKVNLFAMPHPTSPDHLILSFTRGDGEKDLPQKGVLVADNKSYALELSPDKQAEKEDTSLALSESALPPVKNVVPSAPSDSINSLTVALAFAFLGGIILNLMPCVLPVVALKVLDFVNLAGQDRWHTLKHGLFFAAGVLVSFWALAGLLLILQSLGESVGWGFQLQEPFFVAALAILMVIFSLSLFGVFEMGAVFASWAGQKEHSKKSKKKANDSHSTAAFFSGVLATAVATPCTGPFLGSAIGYAVTLPPLGALAIFTSLGLGMALPYLLLTAFPQLLRFIPRPGKWMETFRQAMGFMMLTAALWLTWVFASQTLEPASMILLGAYILIGIACWTLGKWATPFSRKRTRFISWGAAALLMIVSFKAVSVASSFEKTSHPASEMIAEGDWEDFSPARLSELKAKGIPVFVDFTAKWCITCQFNHLALVADSVEAKIREKGIVKMKADWTQRNPEITAEMKKFGRSGVPLYVLYEGNNPEILPQTLTPDIILSSFEKVIPVIHAF